MTGLGSSVREFLLAFADGKPAYRIAVKFDVSQSGNRLGAKVFVDAPLNDAE